MICCALLWQDLSSLSLSAYTEIREGGNKTPWGRRLKGAASAAGKGNCLITTDLFVAIRR